MNNKNLLIRDQDTYLPNPSHLNAEVERMMMNYNNSVNQGKPIDVREMLAAQLLTNVISVYNMIYKQFTSKKEKHA